MAAGYPTILHAGVAWHPVDSEYGCGQVCAHSPHLTRALLRLRT